MWIEFSHHEKLYRFVEHQSKRGMGLVDCIRGKSQTLNLLTIILY